MTVTCSRPRCLPVTCRPLAGLRTITTEPMHGPGGGMDVMGDEGDGYTDDHDDYAEVDGEGEEGHADGERVSSERFMADIYNA